MKNIGHDRECFWDTELLNEEKTTAEFRVHEPIGREIVMKLDAPWEGRCSDFFNFFRDDGKYRLYYLGRDTIHTPIVVCYAESRDGFHWEKPSLGICEFQGSKDNNIIMDIPRMESGIDNFMVFRDDNPECLPDRKYKAVALYQGPENPDVPQLWAFFSPDGIHFGKGCKVTDKGTFDSLNVVFWDNMTKKYRGYIRNSHDADGKDYDIAAEGAIRDVRYIESEDFIHWSDPIRLDYGDEDRIPMYTNNVMPYPRAPHIYIGTPTRYIERKEWTGNYDELCGAEARKEKMKEHPRLGLAITDCVFMCSRDGKKFQRYDDAFLRPLPEVEENWVYGDCYPARGILEHTPSDVFDADEEISILNFEKHWVGLRRYSLRCDGFVSLRAGGKKEAAVVTKPFCYDGSEMYINFSTSAMGYLYLTLVSKDGKRVESCETFGNSIHRRVSFPKGEVASLAGQEVTLEVRMLDADLYAMQFL